jgi:hypothetical protein
VTSRKYTILGGPSKHDLQMIGEVAADNHNVAQTRARKQYRDFFGGDDIMLVIPSTSVHMYIVH